MSYADTRAFSRAAGRTRIVVGDTDVTYFRDKTTPTPRYTLTEPFAYGAASLTFPQVHAGYEADELGTGDLTWCREGARVVISRVFEDDSETVDYVGRVISIQPEGRPLTLEIGGEFSGPSSLQEEQTQMYRSSRDVGRWASLAAAKVGLGFTPWFGPETGIMLTHTGGQSSLSWAQYLGAMSQDVDGHQRAIMPTTWGSSTYQFVLKDYTTVHGTIFNDDARAVVSVRRDVAEAPNAIYGTCITPDGERCGNNKWPGVFSGAAPDYPMAGDADFGLGTTDADTVNLDGITVLYTKLRETGNLPFQIMNTGVYTSDFVAAVRKLQLKVGLPVTGTMTLTTWKRLYNAEYVGFTVNGAFKAPLAVDPRVEEFLYTTNGSIAGRNPDYDATILRSERTIDYGPGVEESVMFAHAASILTRSLTYKNWVGTIRLNGNGAFTGSHTSEAGLTADDMLSFYDIRPGQNYFVPYFDGGTVFHVAGVDVDDSGATLTVDTQARDLVEVREIMARDAESRRQPHREWMAQNRIGKPSTTLIARDKDFGWTDRKHHLKGGKWNKITVLLGQHGQINRTHIELVNDEAEFAVALTTREFSEEHFGNRTGNPLAIADESWIETGDVQDWLDDRKILYAIGDGKQPCGYGRRRKLDDAGNPTGRPLTGVLLDDTPIPYIHAAHQSVIGFLYIWPDRDCTLHQGRVFYPQLDDAA